jgi:hypothetical protein
MGGSGGMIAASAVELPTFDSLSNPRFSRRGTTSENTKETETAPTGRLHRRQICPRNLHMELLKNLNDDQIALLGCAGALFVTGLMMSLSHFVGRARMRTAEVPAKVIPATTLPVRDLPQPILAAESERNAA